MAEQMPAEFIKSDRGGKLLIVDNFLLRKDYVRADKTHYKCRSANCKVRAAVTGDYISSIRGEHDHPNNAEEAHKKRFANQMKEMAMATPTAVPQIYRSQIATAVHEDNNVPPPLIGIQDSIYRARRKTLPALPNNVEDLIMDPFVTDRCLIFDIRNQQQQRIIGITSNSLISHLAKADRIQFDGTFESVPHLFYQLYIIHGKILGSWEPLVFTLMPSKTADSYQTLWDEIHRQVHGVAGHSMRATYTICDFERAAIDAVVSQWPTLPPPKTKGCFFHYTQAVLRATKRIGLWRSYNTDNDVKKFVRRLMALPLIPMDRIDDAWLEIVGDAPDPNHPQRDLCTELENYIVNTWIDDNALFERQLWNHYGEDNDKTSNAAESSHHRINSICGKNRLNIHAFCREISSEVSNSETKINQRELGAPIPKKKKTSTIFRDRLSRYRAEYERGDRNLRQFLDASSYQVHEHLV